MHVTCEQCDREFDTEREPATPAQNTMRCPSCGTEADVGAGIESDGGDVVVESGGEEVHIHIHVHK